MNDNIIMGPWKDSGKNQSQRKEEQKKLQEDRSLIEKITETAMVQFIHSMNEININIKDENFSLEIGFINECIKSMLHRELGYSHPMTRFIQTLVVIGEDEEKTQYSHFDTERLIEILDSIVEDLDE